jgi:TonB family protein
VSHSDPFYPTEARGKKIEGSVELRAMFGLSGGIANIKAISGPPILTAAAEAALREWRYEPTFINGDPVETQADITMVFRLP